MATQTVVINPSIGQLYTELKQQPYHIGVDHAEPSSTEDIKDKVPTVKPVPIDWTIKGHTETYGGKACSLGKLAFDGFFVPRSWVIPCKYSLTRPRVRLFNVIDKNAKYAVRSGAPISMPGLLETKLNVPYKEVRQAISSVWDSWHAPHAAEYRKDNKIPDEIGTAVVLCEMVPAVYAGVAFTADPNDVESKDLFNPVVEYVEGLAEGLVGGTVTPKTVTKEEPWWPRLESALQIAHNTYGASDIEFCITKEKHTWIEGKYNWKIWFVQQRALKFAPPQGIDPPDPTRIVIFTGMSVGSPGKAVGKIKHSSNFKPGDILYVPNFSPEYYPLMSKASALLCREGGSTCHAAIVARERGIPAISGVNFSDWDGSESFKIKNIPYLIQGKQASIFEAQESDTPDQVAQEVTSAHTPKVPNMGMYELPQLDTCMLLYIFYSAIEYHRKEKITAEEKARIVEEIAHIMSTYLYMITICEIRHVFRTGVSREYVDIQMLLKCGVTLPMFSNKADRVSFVEGGNIPQPYSLEKTITILKTVKSLFLLGGWGSSFGGKKWANITEVVLSYFNGELSPVLFIDKCFNLRHNGGLAFRKLNWMNGDNGTMDALLDAKQKGYSALVSRMGAPPNFKSLLANLTPVEVKEDPISDTPILAKSDIEHLEKGQLLNDCKCTECMIIKTKYEDYLKKYNIPQNVQTKAAQAE